MKPWRRGGEAGGSITTSKGARAVEWHCCRGQSLPWRLLHDSEGAGQGRRTTPRLLPGHDYSSALSRGC